MTKTMGVILEELTEDNKYYEKNNISNNLEILRQELIEYILNFRTENSQEKCEYLSRSTDEDMKKIIDSIAFNFEEKIEFYHQYINYLYQMTDAIHNIISYKDKSLQE